MTVKNISFDGKVDTYKKFKGLLISQDKKLQEVFNQFMEDYILKFGDGDGTTNMDQFLENPLMLAMPAFMADRGKWVKHIQSHTQKDAQTILWQAQTIGSLAQKKVDYDTTLVRIN